MYIQCLCKMPAAPQHSHPNSYNPAISRSLTPLNINTITQPPQTSHTFHHVPQSSPESADQGKLALQHPYLFGPLPLSILIAPKDKPFQVHFTHSAVPACVTRRCGPSCMSFNCLSLSYIQHIGPVGSQIQIAPIISCQIPNCTVNCS